VLADDAVAVGSTNIATTRDPSVVTKPRSRPFGVHTRLIGAIVVVSALLLVGVAGSWRAPGATMDEGIVLEYPELILHGEVPFRDFQSSYGPGAYLPLAAAYQVLGPSMTVERAVGVAYRLGVVLAMLALLWPLGAGLAIAGASFTTLAILPVGSPQVPVAYGWYFALACLLWGLWCARAAMTDQRPRVATALWVVAGLLAGAGASARPDLGVAALLSSSVLVLGSGARARRAFTIGLAVGVSPLIWNLLAAGWSRFWTYGVEARMHQLPVSGYPFPTGIGFLLFLSAATLVVVFAAIQERRELGATPRTRCLLALALLSVVMLPQLLQRADSGHFAFVGPVSLGLLPWALLRRSPSRMTTVAVPVLCGIAIALSSIASAGNTGYVVHNDGRSFTTGTPRDAFELQKVVVWLDTHIAPGRRLFVGPADLQWAFNTRTELYFLMPGLKPAGFYLEFGPGDDTPQFTSRLIEDLHQADVLVLDDVSVPFFRRRIWPEARIGSVAPNGVVRRDFRVAFQVGAYSVWQRRDPRSVATL
jgi:hypothetical protein